MSDLSPILKPEYDYPGPVTPEQLIEAVPLATPFPADGDDAAAGCALFDRRQRPEVHWWIQDELRHMDDWRSDRIAETLGHPPKPFSYPTGIKGLFIDARGTVASGLGDYTEERYLKFLGIFLTAMREADNNIPLDLEDFLSAVDLFLQKPETLILELDAALLQRLASIEGVIEPRKWIPQRIIVTLARVYRRRAISPTNSATP